MNETKYFVISFFVKLNRDSLKHKLIFETHVYLTIFSTENVKTKLMKFLKQYFLNGSNRTENNRIKIVGDFCTYR